MEPLEAKIREDGGNHCLELILPDGSALIPLTEDKPQVVKEVFNKLVLLLKKTPFQFRFEKGAEDLYSQISDEYINQLNTELEIVRSDLEDYDLVEPSVE